MTIKVINHGQSDTDIKNYDSKRYYDPAYMEAEWQHLWRKSWLLAGLVSDVREPGDYFVFDLGREQIIVTRTQNGDICGFYNVCQHRGNRLVTTERGRLNQFRCRYHAWTYELDGRLKSVPYEERFPAGVPCAQRSLQSVQVAVWAGFVFVNLAQESESLQTSLGLVVEHLDAYAFADMVLVEDQTVSLACNWKAVIDNFSELYHVDFLHPQHKRMVDCCNDTVHLFERGHTGLAVPGATVSPRFPIPEEPTDLQSAQLTSLGLDPKNFRGRVLDVREAVQQAKREVGAQRGVDYSAFTNEQLSDVWQYNLFPNVVLSFTPEHCWVMRARPHPTDPQRCLFDKYSMLRMAAPDVFAAQGAIVGPGSSAEQHALHTGVVHVRPQPDRFDHTAIIDGTKTMTDTIDQDIELLGDVQMGMASAGFDQVWLSEDELRVQHFHDELDARLLDAQLG